MKIAKHIVNMIQKVSPFEKKSEEENVTLCLYSIFEWAKENDHRLFCICHHDKEENFVSFNFFFNPDGDMMLSDTSDKNEFNFEIRVKKGGVKDLYEKLLLALAYSEARMKQMSGDDFPDGFLGGDIDDDFF